MVPRPAPIPCTLNQTSRGSARKSSRQVKRKAFNFTNKPENAILLDEEEEISIVPDSENTDPDDIIISTLKKTKRRKIFNDLSEEVKKQKDHPEGSHYSCVGLNEERTKSPIELWTTDSLKLREDLELESGGFGLGEYRGQCKDQNNEDPGETEANSLPQSPKVYGSENLMGKITEIKSKLDYFRKVKKEFELELAEIFYRNKDNLGAISLLEKYELMLEDKPNWSDIMVEKVICNQQDIVATKNISNVLNKLNATFEITNITQKGGFGEDIDIEDGMLGEDTERSPTQQAGQTGAKLSKRVKEKNDGKEAGGLEDMEASSFSVGVTQETYANKVWEDKPDEMRSYVCQALEQTETSKDANVTELEQGKNDGKVVPLLEDLEALNFSFGFTQETDSIKGGKVDKVSNEMQDRFRPNFSLGVSQEQRKGVEEEEEEDEMHADIDHESVNQDPEASKDNLIEEMDLKTSSENINSQRIEESGKKIFPGYMLINSKMDEKPKKEEKNKGRRIFEYIFIPNLKVEISN
ncbi:hypothetical protein L1987_60949 [Smallanthus sonchifolius]|uniref:Uncharacterized protein n=1 Tax=Smallanthus sonchifolius TaxID=185202 RepID=A0ACB9D9E1_9ASTR|nr:hypothetical protein L1987_60949 [Smallanthus sonchifolius]